MGRDKMSDINKIKYDNYESEPTSEPTSENIPTNEDIHNVVPSNDYVEDVSAALSYTRTNTICQFC